MKNTNKKPNTWKIQTHKYVFKPVESHIGLSLSHIIFALYFSPVRYTAPVLSVGQQECHLTRARSFLVTLLLHHSYAFSTSQEGIAVLQTNKQTSLYVRVAWDWWLGHLPRSPETGEGGDWWSWPMGVKAEGTSRVQVCHREFEKNASILGIHTISFQKTLLSTNKQTNMV